MPWTMRRSLCLDCRTALPVGTPCPAAKSHRVVPLDEPGGREALLTEVWGPKDVRKRIVEATRAGALGGTGGSILDGCSGCGSPFDDLGVLLVFVVLFLAIAGIWLAAGWLRERWRMRRLARHARGASAAGPTSGPPTGVVGTIAPGKTIADPLTAHECVAFAAQLQFRGKTMLRDAVTLGFDVELPTGQRVRIPPGLCVIEEPSSPRDVSTRRKDLAAYRESIYPAHPRAARPDRSENTAAAKAWRLLESDLGPFPSDRVLMTTLAPGQRVEIASELVPVAGGESGYREQVATVLEPRGVVRLRTC